MSRKWDHSLKGEKKNQNAKWEFRLWHRLGLNIRVFEWSVVSGSWSWDTPWQLGSLRATHTKSKYARWQSLVMGPTTFKAEIRWRHCCVGFYSVLYIYLLLQKSEFPRSESRARHLNLLLSTFFFFSFFFSFCSWRQLQRISEEEINSQRQSTVKKKNLILKLSGPTTNTNWWSRWSGACICLVNQVSDQSLVNKDKKSWLGVWRIKSVFHLKDR